ncbi:VWA domain-containing protein [Terriglobus sp.]|uniref:VWA domain-containing protein n=1 Tax=Terriglobus sp. TaxID=1889013 RepID=UPI003B00B073
MTLLQWSGLLTLAVSLCGASSLPAQDEGAADAPTLRVQSRLVIEDVLVMDAHGNPVHGLQASSFHILDNGRPQQVRNFQEGSPQVPSSVAVESLPAGTFRSDTGYGAAATTEVLLIDTDDMELADQMFLGQELKKSVAGMPADLPVALFAVRSGRIIPVLTATTDRAALSRAIAETLPVQNHAIDSRFQSALNQLMTVAAFLQQTQGRKNVMWFAGQFPLVPVPPADGSEAGPQPDISVREHEIHQVQEALAEARVSVFPVDVRGVLPATFAFTVAANVSDARSQMHALAAATGGRAYMLNNLSDEIGEAIDVGRSAYSLSYSPAAYRMDQSFHQVTVQVDGGYTVSYRMGYLATYTGAAGEPPRSRLLRGGVKTADAASNVPLVFQVRLLAHDDPQHITVDFSMALAELKQEHAQGVWSSKLLVATYAYDASGKVRSGKVQQLDTALSDVQFQQASDKGQRVATRQELTLPKGAKYLLVVARDRDSQRTGNVLLQTRLLASLPPAVVPPTSEAAPITAPAAP